MDNRIAYKKGPPRKLGAGLFRNEANQPSSIALLRTAPLSALVASRA
jgi:hypothetical protein